MTQSYIGSVSSVSCSVMSNSLRPNGLQHATPPCPSPTPGVYSNSCLWSHPTISSSVIPFSCLQVFPPSGFFSMIQLFQWIFRIDFFGDGLVGSPCSPRDSQESSPNRSSKVSILQHSTFFIVQLSYPYMTTGKTIALTRWTVIGKVMSLLFNMPSSLVTIFLPKSKHLVISWLQSPSALILEPKKIKSVTVSIFSPCICHEVMGPDTTFYFFFFEENIMVLI